MLNDTDVHKLDDRWTARGAGGPVAVISSQVVPLAPRQLAAAKRMPAHFFVVAFQSCKREKSASSSAPTS